MSNDALKLAAAERALLSERAAPRRVLEFALGRGCARAALAGLAGGGLAAALVA